MNIKELKENLKTFNLYLTDKEIADCWGIDKSAFSKKQKLGSEIKLKHIEQLQQKYNISLINNQLISSTVNINPLNVSCGTGVINLDIDYMQFDSQSKYSYCLCNGDSMQPVLNNGDLLIIQLQDYIDRQNAIYAFTYENEQYCKYLSKDLNTLVVSSENKKYADLRLVEDDLNKVRIIGRLVGAIRKF